MITSSAFLQASSRNSASLAVKTAAPFDKRQCAESEEELRDVVKIYAQDTHHVEDGLREVDLPHEYPGQPHHPCHYHGEDEDRPVVEHPAVHHDQAGHAQHGEACDEHQAQDLHEIGERELDVEHPTYPDDQTRHHEVWEDLYQELVATGDLPDGVPLGRQPLGGVVDPFVEILLLLGEPAPAHVSSEEVIG